MADLTTSKELLQFLYRSSVLHLHRLNDGWRLVQLGETSMCVTDRCLKLPLFGLSKPPNKGVRTIKPKYG